MRPRLWRTFESGERSVSSRNLEFLLKPRSVALIGASDRARSVGSTVMHNLLQGGFRGPLYPVNLHRPSVAGQRAYARVGDLPEPPDLAVLCTPAPSVPGLIEELAGIGTRAAIVISAGLEQPDATGQPLAAGMLQAARRVGLRILGPNCIGVLVPGIGLNASFAHVGARAGSLAFVAQSGALTTAMLDWAQGARVGFSHFISLGNAADVDFGDLLDYLGRDAGTSAILLYVEAISSARKFMSAARAAARNKPIIVVKSGRSIEAAAAAHSHSGAMAGADAVYEAAFRRAGILRVDETRELFDAAEMLAHVKPYRGPRLLIVSNGGGPGVMATDAFVAQAGALAQLVPQTLRRLDGVLPSAAARANPLDIGGDADVERYRKVLGAVLQDPAVQGLLVIHAPTAVASVSEVELGCSALLANAPCPTLACWMGAEAAAQTGTDAAGAVPTYGTPEEAVGAFQRIVRYQQSQALLLEAPASIMEGFAPDVEAARRVVQQALSEEREVLSEPESKAVLAAYGIPVVPTRVAPEGAGLRAAAQELGYPVALKILSPDISHKSDVGGVALNLSSAEELERAAVHMLERCHEHLPAARIQGFTVQKMVRRGGACELLAGLAVDPTFGPIVLFGQGGTAVEVIGDRAIGLPPLNAVLARDLIAQTRVHRLLRGFRAQPPADMQALERVLIALSQLAADVPEIIELDINPLLADAQGVIALDARVRVARSASSGSARLAIRPYPAELEEQVLWAGRRLLLRPLRPEDFAQHQRFLARVSPEDLRMRFFASLRAVPEREIARLTQIDYEREMAFIAVEDADCADAQTLGVARIGTDPDNLEAEFAVLVRSDLRGQGLGSLLLQKLTQYARSRGTQRLSGQVLPENERMLQLGKALGFESQLDQHGLVRLRLELQRKSGGMAS